MIIHKHHSVTQALYRHRLSLPELAARLGVPVRDLNREALPEETEVALHHMALEAPDPLTAVADLPADAADRRERLLEDTLLLTQQCITLVAKLNVMEDLYAQQVSALNRLRLHVNGQKFDPALAHLPVGNWKMARPLEAKLERGVEANSPGARESTETRLAQATGGLEHIRDKRLPAYEATEDRLEDCHQLFTAYDYELNRLALDKELRRKQREKAETTAPLVLDPNGQNLSLTAQKPEAALAQELAEFAVEEAMVQQRSQERLLRKEGKVLKQQLIEEAFDALLPCLEAGDTQVRPIITPEALVMAPAADGKEKDKKGNSKRPTPKVLIERVEKPLLPALEATAAQEAPALPAKQAKQTKQAAPVTAPMPQQAPAAPKEAPAAELHTRKPASATDGAERGAKQGATNGATTSAKFSDRVAASVTAKVATRAASGPQPGKKRGKKGKKDKRGTGPSGERRPINWLAHHEVIYQQQIAKNGGKAPRGRLRGEVFKAIMRQHPKPPDPDADSG